MSNSTIEQQLVSYLTDAHAIEVQALAQLRGAPKAAGVDRLGAVLHEHERETERHEQLIRKRLRAHDAEPARLKDAAMAIGGTGFLLFARSQPDTPGKLAAHAYSFEHLEVAAYELLGRVAKQAGDDDTAATAAEIREQEAAAGRRIAACFDATVEASIRAKVETALSQQLLSYLADAHALETQAIELLEKASKIGGDPRLVEAYRSHLQETLGHRSAVDSMLESRGSSPSTLKDIALKVGGINWGLFFGAQPDTPGKLAAFAFAFEHLEIAAYEQLARVARQAGDEQAAVEAERILTEERKAAEKIATLFDVAAQASFEALGITSQRR